MMLKHYFVTWEIDIFNADSPQEAARRAQAIQRDPTSRATIFRVQEHDSADFVLIDLDDI